MEKWFRLGFPFYCCLFFFLPVWPREELTERRGTVPLPKHTFCACAPLALHPLRDMTRRPSVPNSPFSPTRHSRRLGGPLLANNRRRGRDGASITAAQRPANNAAPVLAVAQEDEIRKADVGRRAEEDRLGDVLVIGGLLGGGEGSDGGGLVAGACVGELAGQCNKGGYGWASHGTPMKLLGAVRSGTNSWPGGGYRSSWLRVCK